MRALVFLFACLSLIASAWGNNLILGRHLFGDVLIESRPIFKPPVPGVSHRETIDITAPPGYVISFVSVINRNPRVVNIKPTKGYIGQDSMSLVATGRPGWALVMKVTVFAIHSKHHSTTTTSTSSTITSSQSTTTSTEPTTTNTQSTTTSTEPTTTNTQSTIPTNETTTTRTQTTIPTTETTTMSTPRPGTWTPQPTGTPGPDTWSLPTKGNQPASSIYRTKEYHIMKFLAP